MASLGIASPLWPFPLSYHHFLEQCSILSANNCWLSHLSLSWLRSLIPAWVLVTDNTNAWACYTSCYLILIQESETLPYPTGCHANDTIWGIRKAQARRILGGHSLSSLSSQHSYCCNTPIMVYIIIPIFQLVKPRLKNIFSKAMSS